MEPKTEVTVLMPCLNESETIAICIAKASDWAKTSGVDVEILVADNGSTDGSQLISKSLGARVIDVSTKGYGAAIYEGALQAQGNYIIVGDSDDSYDFSDLDPFLEELRNGADLVMGNRFSGGIAKGAMPWKNRYIGNPVLTQIGKTLFKVKINDFHCGLRGFSKTAFTKMDLKTTGMEFASEMVIKASIRGLRITEVPTTLKKDGRSRPPHLRPWRDGWRHLKFMFSMSPRWLFTYPGILLLLVGSSLHFPLLFSDLEFLGTQFSVNTLFYTQSVATLGFVSVIFGLVISAFAMREGLLEETKFFKWMRLKPVFEVGSLFGILLTGLGLWIAGETFATWANASFGQLTTNLLLRKVSASTTLIVLGGLTTSAAFIYGFLTLPLRTKQATNK
jgi:glycosyltransferase involved in cell wall biosynthesis